MSPHVIHSAAAWHGAKIAKNPRWQFTIQPGDIDEIDQALERAKAASGAIATIDSTLFQLSGLATRLKTMANELENGCGFVRLRGLPMERWSQEDLQLVWMGIASHLGQPVSQNSNGQLMREIRAEAGDVGQRYGQLPASSGSFLSSRARTASNAELRYHTDRTDIVGLLCTGVAKQGGYSKLSSSVTVHNEMLQRYPESCALLYQDLPRSRIGEETGGEKSWYQLPVWGLRDGHFTSHYSRTYVEALTHVAGAPEVTENQWQALDLLAEIAEQQHFQMRMEKGDIQFLNNHVIYHSRTAFVDDPKHGYQRCLLRIWLSSPQRPLPISHGVLWRNVEPGQVRGGIGLNPV